MARPTNSRFLAWYKYRFPRNYGKDFDKSYMAQWKDRFSTPRNAWSAGDIETRKSLIKFFPRTFKGLKISDNLYNAEWGWRFIKW